MKVNGSISDRGRDISEMFINGSSGFLVYLSTLKGKHWLLLKFKNSKIAKQQNKHL